MSSSEKLNVIIIFSDHLRADALGCFGNSVIKTPNIDQLSKSGTQFNQCMITQPTCTPSRASILTGRYPSAIRTRMVGCSMPKEEITIAEILRKNGYKTASIGKMHLVPQFIEQEIINDTITSYEDDCGKKQYNYYGFEEIDLVNGHGYRCIGDKYTQWLNEQVPDARKLKSKVERYEDGTKDTLVYPLPERVHSSNYIGDKAVEFIENQDETPFFLHVSFPDPHPPYSVPEPYASMYNPDELESPILPITESNGLNGRFQDIYFGRKNNRMITVDGKMCDSPLGTNYDDYSQYAVNNWKKVRSLYYGMVSLMDKNVGKILEALNRKQLRHNTLIVFVADHGDYLGDHGFSGKGFHFDSVIRVPLIYSCPGLIKEQIIDNIASTIDIMPTILEILNIEEPVGVQGISEKSVLLGDSNYRRTSALTENDDDMGKLKMRTITTNEWKLTYYAGEEFGELYDRIRDPRELNNLWNIQEHGEMKNKLLNMLLEEVVCSSDVKNGRNQEPAPSVVKWLPKHYR